MKFLSINFASLISFLITISLSDLYAQNKKYSISNDPKIEHILNEKRKINSSLSINERYKIQIFSGLSEQAKKTLNEFKMENKNVDATIIFQTPNYKVWVGNYRTRMEAERNLVEFKRRYNTSLLIKPTK